MQYRASIATGTQLFLSKRVLSANNPAYCAMTIGFTQLFLPGIAAFVLLFGNVIADDSDSAQSDEDGGETAEHRPGSEGWNSLSDEDKEKLRNALRQVWADATVISAREEVKRASEAYQNAIRQAVRRADPSVAGALAKAQAATEGHLKERFGGGLPGQNGMRRLGDYPMSPPGFLEGLTEEEREKFHEAEKEAKTTQAVQDALQALEALRMKDDAIKVKRLQAYRNIRETTMNEMVKADPSLKEIQGRLESMARRGQKGDGKGSAKGNPKGLPQTR